MYRLLRFFIKVRARSFCCSFFPNRSRLRWVAIWYAALQTVLIDLHLFRQHMTFIENAAVKTAAFSRLTTEIPQTDFYFDHRKGIPFFKGMPFLFVYCPAKFEGLPLLVPLVLGGLGILSQQFRPDLIVIPLHRGSIHV